MPRAGSLGQALSGAASGDGTTSDALSMFVGCKI
jgi:hypothetical protein